MSRPVQLGELTALYNFIVSKPGVIQATAAKSLGWSNTTVSRRLSQLERVGYLLWEDDVHRLYPYKIVKEGYSPHTWG